MRISEESGVRSPRPVPPKTRFRLLTPYFSLLTSHSSLPHLCSSVFICGFYALGKERRMATTDSTAPRLAFVHVDDVPWTEVIAQQHGERRVSVHEKFLEW